MAHSQFDADGFYCALDSVRISRKLTWKDVAAQSGVSASTLTRMAQGRRPDVDSLAALTEWSGLDANRFLVSKATKKDEFGEVALEQVTALFRADPNLDSEAASAIETTLKVLYGQLRREQ